MHMWGFGWLGMLMFWIAVIFFIALVVKWLLQQGRSDPGGPAQGESALEILKKRYARGEINKEEFEQKKKDFTGI